MNWRPGGHVTLPPMKARNTAASGIHSDEFAQQQGFKRAVVAGPNFLSFITTGFESAFGPVWLQKGRITCRFTSPVHDGDEVRPVIFVANAGQELDATWESSVDGVIVAHGRATWSPHPDVTPEPRGSAGELTDLRPLHVGDRVPKNVIVAERDAITRYCTLNGDTLDHTSRVPTAFLTFLLFGPARRWLDSEGVGPGMWGEIDIRQHAALVPGKQYQYSGEVIGLRARGNLELIDFEFSARDTAGRLACSITHTHIIPHRNRGVSG